MTKVKVKINPQYEKFLRARALRLVRVAVTDKKLITRIRNMLVLDIGKNLKLPSGARPQPISRAWAIRRTKLATVNKAAKFFKRFASNLTFTGRFLRSFIGSLKVENKQVIYSIGPTGTHPGYKNLKGTKTKPVANSVIGQAFIDRGDDYTVLSEDNKAKIKKIVIGRIRKEIKLKLKF